MNRLFRGKNMWLLALLMLFIPGFFISLLLKKSGIELIILSFAFSTTLIIMSLFITSLIFNEFNFSIIYILTFILAIVALYKKSKIEIQHLKIPKSMIERIMILIILLIVLMTTSNVLIMPILNYDAIQFIATIGKKMHQLNTIPLIYGHSPLEYVWAYQTPVYLEHVWFRAHNASFLIKGISPLYAIMLILSTILLAREIKAPTIFSVLILILSQLFILLFVINMNIAYGLFFTITIFYAFKYLKYRENQDLIISGIIAGVATWYKYIGIVSIIPICLVLLKEKRFEKTFIFLICWSIVGLPWLIRNFVLLDNPIYPMFPTLFGGLGLEKWFFIPIYNIWLSSTKNISYFFDEVLQQFLYLNLSFIGFGLYLINYLKNRRDNNKEVVFLILVVLVFYIIYLSVIFYPPRTTIRYFIAIIPIMAVLSAKSLIKLLDIKYSKKFLIIFIAFLTIVSFYTSMRMQNFYNTVAEYGIPTEEEALSLNAADYPLWQYVNKMNVSSKFLLVAYYRTYYLNVDYLSIESLEMMKLHKTKNLTEAVQFLKQSNIGYMIVDAGSYPQPWWNLNIIIQNLNNSSYFTPLKTFEKTKITLYKIN